MRLWSPSVADTFHLEIQTEDCDLSRVYVILCMSTSDLFSPRVFEDLRRKLLMMTPRHRLKAVDVALIAATSDISTIKTKTKLSDQ